MSKDKKNDNYQKILNGIDLSKAHDMLIDYVTGLPTLNFVLEEIKTLSAKNSAAVISVNITSLVNLETLYGWKNFDALLVRTAETLSSMKGQIFRRDDSISVLFPASSNFIIFLSAPRNNQCINLENIEMISRRVGEALKASAGAPGSVIPGEYINYSIGIALISENEMQRVERSLFSAIREAEIAGINGEIKERQKIREDIRNIIVHEEVRTVFQPIVSVKDSEILAYEALTRGPRTSKYELPVVLFSAADAHGYSEELEWLCIAKAIINFNLNSGFMNKNRPGARPGKGLLLFLNVDPKTFVEAGVIVARFSELVKKYNLNPENIVLEITERTAIADFDSFKTIVEELKKMGFGIAIDDAGAGYSSLQAIAELRPKYLKFDMVLVRDIDKDFIKQELLKTLLDFANKTGSIVIAEGVETQAEYDTVRALGVHCAQGYYFARPSPQFIEMIQLL